MSDLNIFVDRGDPAAADFDQDDLTMDTNWYDLDLSSIVPAGATHVQITGFVSDNTAGAWLMFRENGNSNAVNRLICYAQVNSIAIGFNGIIACDSNRVIEYRASEALASVNITVGGWIIPLSASGVINLSADASPTIDDLIYTINDPGGTPADRKVTLQNALKLAPHWVDRGAVTAADKAVGDLTTDGTWRDLDLSAIVPAGAIAISLGVLVNDDAGNILAFRKNGDSTSIAAARSITCQVNAVNNSGCLLVPCDSSRVIEYYATNTSWTTIDIYVLGWYIDTVN